MPYVLSAKHGVELTGLQPGGLAIVGALTRAAAACQTDLVITCGREGHLPADPHSRGDALDVSVHGMSPALVVQVKAFLEQILTDAFTVLYETPEKPPDPQLAPIAYVNSGASAPHFHIQVRKGTAWPPANTLNA